MRIYIVRAKVRTILEWADRLLSKMLVGWGSGVEWMDGYSLDCYDYWRACGANKREFNQTFKRVILRVCFFLYKMQ